jgi:hypothetical protein
VQKQSSFIDLIMMVVTTVCIPLLAWTSITLWDLNVQVTRLSEVTSQLAMRLDDTNDVLVTRVEFDAHNERLNGERSRISIRLSKHDDQIRSLEIRR